MSTRPSSTVTHTTTLRWAGSQPSCLKPEQAFLIIHTWQPLKNCFLLMVFMLLINHRPWEPDVNVIRILKLAFQRPQFQAKQFTMTANDSLASSVFPLAQSTKTLHLCLRIALSISQYVSKSNSPLRCSP